MRAWIANTDYEWYRFLSGRPDLDEVNFWRPSSGTFRALASGEPLLFRLKTPLNKIAGLGFFVHFSVLPRKPRLGGLRGEERSGLRNSDAREDREVSPRSS